MKSLKPVALDLLGERANRIWYYRDAEIESLKRQLSNESEKLAVSVHEVEELKENLDDARIVIGSLRNRLADELGLY
jgi:ornithine cyclodeaminase/alanine dehydrogenase-like protein (mu-crystallin family)